MKQGIISDSTKSAKQLAQDIARKLAQEPLEILKTSREQVTGEKPTPPENSQPSDNPDQQKQVHDANMLNDKLKSVRMVEALNREIGDIQKQDLFSDLQRRISEGEEVPLEDFAELTFEQRDVLKAQMEAVKVQKENAQVESVPLFGSSKPNRRMGQKQQAQKEQTRVEKPVPPSG